ncbi:hypothetical protein L9F63_017763 [Diploptera punctata]|uniref:Repulsive guidance molecule A n=1 Tax=Diploptera punctata TaxID=6984 RepID=A0AAD7ZY02_DIPPU|nr:hypothetical protein L9F63_017763 [Diploptera punctata]
MAVRCEECKADKCSREFSIAMNELGIGDPEPTAEFCQVAKDYGACLKATARSCRGNLNYHSMQSTMIRLTNDFDCPRLLKKISPGHVVTPSSSLIPPTTRHPPTTSRPNPQCIFQGRRVFRHCGLFGDPHLKTFENEYQTCRVRGAWPLIDNPFLAVQVTNEPVVEGSPATATTKVTIIIRGNSNAPCSTEKTYEATSDAPLPVMFIDGTQRSGSDDSILLSVYEPHRVEIYVRYIETTLIIRKAGTYLAFAVRMPEELVNYNSRGDYSESRLQLCVRGCPKAERLDPIAERGHKLPWDKAIEWCRSTDSNEVTANLTDPYLDWCVFDVMTTGDGDIANEFRAAAHSAQADDMTLDPVSLKNRTISHVKTDTNSALVLDVPSVLVLLLVVALLRRTSE